VLRDGFSGGGSTLGNWPSPWKRSELEHTFDAVGNGLVTFHNSLLAMENFDPSEWEVVGVSMGSAASKRVPFEIPHFQLN
jgi:hypothetical protein